MILTPDFGGIFQTEFSVQSMDFDLVNKGAGCNFERGIDQKQSYCHLHLPPI